MNFFIEKKVNDIRDVIQGRLVKRAFHFEVDWNMGEDIRKTDATKIAKTPKAWRESCNGMVTCLENQTMYPNDIRPFLCLYLYSGIIK